MHKDLQNAAISLNESNSWRRLTTKEHTWLKTWFQTPLCTARRRLVLVNAPTKSLAKILRKFL